MALDPDDIKAFQAAYRKAFGEDIEEDEAAELGDRLIELYRIILTKSDTPATAASSDPPGTLGTSGTLI